MSKSKAWAGALAASSNAKKITEMDTLAEQKDARQRARKGHFSLDKIKDRERSTRQLNAKHVEGLAESIAELGLIQSLAIDEQGVLLAGGHRLAALKWLRDAQPEVYNQWFEDNLVPVVTLHIGDASDRDRRALAIELSENEKRRDYTKGEIHQLAERLRAAGYRDGRGRLAAGEKHLVPALALVLGRSLRTARRLLEDKPKAATVATGVDTLQALQRCERAMQHYLRTVAKPPKESAHQKFHTAVTEAVSFVYSAIYSQQEVGQVTEFPTPTAPGQTAEAIP